MTWPFVYLGVWAAAMIGFAPWLFGRESGWSVARRQPWITRTLLFIPLSNAWRRRVRPEDQASVARWRRRAQFWYFVLLLAPMLALYAALWCGIAA